MKKLLAFVITLTGFFAAASATYACIFFIYEPRKR